MISQDWFASVVVADTLWLLAVSAYIYITFLGYSGAPNFVFASPQQPAALPFLKRTELFLYPILAVVLVFVMAVVMRWNISMTVFHYYGFHDSAMVPPA